MKYLFMLLTISIVILSSCATKRYCTPSKRSRDYAKGEHVKTTLVAVHRTMRGNKHIFVTVSGDTITRYFNYRGFKVGCCYELTM